MKFFVSSILLLSTITSFSKQTFTHISDKGNISNNSTFIDAKELNNNPNAIIIVEYDGASGAANPHRIDVCLDGTNIIISRNKKEAFMETFRKI